MKFLQFSHHLQNYNLTIQKTMYLFALLQKMFRLRLVLFSIVLMSCGFDHAVSKNIQPSNESSKDIQEPVKLCLTKICNDTASKILKKMDLTADPCNDFYQFACGGHIKLSSTPYYDKIQHFLERHISVTDLTSNIEDPIKQDEPRPLKMLKKYFQSCMNESPTKNKSVDSLLQLVKSYGGWPIIEGEKWNETNFNWIKFIAELQKKGYIMDNMPQIIDSSTLAEMDPLQEIELKRGRITELFPRNANNKTIDIIREDIVNITVGFGANRTFAEEEVRELFNFASKLSDLNNNPNRYRGLTKKFREIKKKFPNSLTEIIERLITPFIEIKDHTYIYMRQSTYDLGILMSNTPKRVQANYIIWSTIFQSNLSFNSHITEMFAKLKKDSGLSPFGKFRLQENMECRKLCVKYMTPYLYALYIRNNFNRNLKNDNIKILENIRKEAIKNVEGATWLSPKMKAIYRDKIEELTFFVVYKGDFFNDTELEQWDKDLNISSSNDFLDNHLNLVSFHKKKSFEKFDILGFSWNFIEKLQDRNTYYYVELNTVVIPPIYLQDILNKVENPEYIKYGVAGGLMGHEIYHSLDSANRIYNASLKKMDFDNSTEEMFNQLDQCIINQYGNIPRGNRNLDGSKHLGENFADIGGFKSSYQAYSHLASQKNESESSLPNLPYSPEQMFWISALNPFCIVPDPNNYDPDDPHSPSDVRFTTAFSNIPEFAKDFNCSVGSRMNPEKKCFV